MKNQLKGIVFLIGFFWLQSLKSQEELVTRMYWNNLSIMNPANSGFEKKYYSSAQYWDEYSGRNGFRRNFRAVADVFIKPVKSGIGLNYKYNELGNVRKSVLRLNYKVTIY